MSKRLWGGLAVALLAALCLAPNVARADDAAPVPIDEAHFPDPQFREFIKKSEYDTDADGVLSSEELAAVTTMDCRNCYSTYFVTYGRRLYSLQGIEYFTSLTDLDCSENEIGELDLSKNTELVNLECWANQLTSLDTSKNIKLKKLCCDNNALTSLNIQGNTELTRLDCYENNLTELDVSGVTAWLELSCQNNELTKLKLTRTVTELNCEENQLTSLDLSNYKDLVDLDCSSNRLSQINVSGCTHLMNVHCNGNQISQLDLSGRANLREVQCSGNRISQLDLSGCTYLSTLNCNNNRLASLDLSDCKYLLILDCSNNQLTSLDLTMRDSAMKRLTCADNAYTVDVGSDRAISLSALPGKFDATKASGWSGGSVSDGVLTVNDDATSVTYRYDCGHGQTVTFTLNVSYAVSFDTGGGSTVDSQTVAGGGKATRPEADPTWVGHVFCGWYADEGLANAFDFENTAINAPTTVHAKWEEDAEAPAIDGIEDGETYCAAQTVTVADKNPGTVTVNGTAVELGEDGSFTLSPAAGEQKVVAADKAGNVTTVTVTVNDGHTWDEGWSHDADEHWRVCSACGEKGDVAEHAGGTATCSSKATCETCGEEYGKLDPENHEALERVEAKEATAEAEGNVEYWRCTGCGKLFSDAAGTTEISKADTVLPKLDPKKDEGDKTDDGNGGQGGDNGSNGSGSNDSTNGAAGGGSDASNGSADGTSGGTTTKTTVTTVTTSGKANAALAQTGDTSAAAVALALAAGLAALGATLIRSKRCDF